MTGIDSLLRTETPSDNLAKQLAKTLRETLVNDLQALLTGEMDSVRRDIISVRDEVKRLRTDLQSLESKVERQGKQLSTLEQFPSFRGQWSSRPSLFVTDVDSVIAAKKRKIGYSA